MSCNSYTDANRHLTLAARIAPRSPTVLNNLAINSLHLGNKHAAIDLFRRSIALDPDNRNALYNLGSIYVGCPKGSWRKPFYKSAQAIRKSPNS